MPIFKHDKGNLFYRRKGKGKTIILLHGILVSSRLFMPVFDNFAKHFDTIAIDLPGHGQSSPLTKEYLDNTEKILEWFMQDLDVYALIGQSMGGLLVNRLIGTIKPKKVIYISIAFDPAKIFKIPARFPAISEFLFKANKNISKTSKLPVKIASLLGVDKWKDTGFLAEQVLMADPASASCALNEIMHRNHVVNYRKETEYLMIHGKNDKVVPNHSHIADTLHAEYIHIPKANHAAMIEQPIYVSDKILQFLIS